MSDFALRGFLVDVDGGERDDGTWLALADRQELVESEAVADHDHGRQKTNRADDIVAFVGREVLPRVGMTGKPGLLSDDVEGGLSTIVLDEVNRGEVVGVGVRPRVERRGDVLKRQVHRDGRHAGPAGVIDRVHPSAFVEE